MLPGWHNKGVTAGCCLDRTGGTRVVTGAHADACMKTVMHCRELLLVSNAFSWPILPRGLATARYCYYCYCCHHPQLLLPLAAALAVLQQLLPGHRLLPLLLVLLPLLHLQQ